MAIFNSYVAIFNSFLYVYHRVIWPTSRADILNHLDDIKNILTYPQSTYNHPQMEKCIIERMQGFMDFHHWGLPKKSEPQPWPRQVTVSKARLATQGLTNVTWGKTLGSSQRQVVTVVVVLVQDTSVQEKIIDINDIKYISMQLVGTYTQLKYT